MQPSLAALAFGRVNHTSPAEPPKTDSSEASQKAKSTPLPFPQNTPEFDFFAGENVLHIGQITAKNWKIPVIKSN